LDLARVVVTPSDGVAGGAAGASVTGGPSAGASELAGSTAGTSATGATCAGGPASRLSTAGASATGAGAGLADLADERAAALPPPSGVVADFGLDLVFGFWAALDADANTVLVRLRGRANCFVGSSPCDSAVVVGAVLLLVVFTPVLLRGSHHWSSSEYTRTPQ
jgi:hypothetical protein